PAGAGRGHLRAADEAARGAAGAEVLPTLDEHVVERHPPAGRRRAIRAHQGECGGAAHRLAASRCIKVEVELKGRCGHVTLLNSPTTLPRTRTSLDRMGSIVSFSGCRRTWSFSRKKRLTVASSPTSATTISPSVASSCGRTTT